MKKTLYIAAIALLFSCSKSEVVKQQSYLETRNSAVNQILKNQVDILPTIFPEQLKIKTLIVSATHLGTFGRLSYQYDDKNRITNIASSSGGNSFLEVKYDDANKTITENGTKFNVDAAGKILTLANGDNYQMFVYKNGFPLEQSGLFTNIFNSKGNMTERVGEESFVFEYTDYPNNIRQEIKSASNFQIAFRDEYSGKFSTHLLKKCVGMPLKGMPKMTAELDFNYEFDEKGRVSKMTVGKLFGGTKFAYFYEYTYF